jgi:hypothetical protein
MELIKNESKPTSLLIKEIEDIERELISLANRLAKIKRILLILKEGD